MESRRTWYTIAEAEDPRLVHQVWLPMDSTIDDLMTAIKHKHPEIDYDIIVYQYGSTEMDRPENCELLLVHSFYSLDEPLEVRRRGSHKILRCRQDPQYRLILCNQHLESIFECLNRYYKLPDDNLGSVFKMVRSAQDCHPKRFSSTFIRTGNSELSYRVLEGSPLPVEDLPDLLLHHEWIFLEHVHRLCQAGSNISAGILLYVGYLARRCYRIQS